MGNKVSHHGATPSHGNPASTNALNTELNNVARNTDDTNKARRLVAEGADLSSTNGPDWRHTPLHQAAFHGRYQMARVLIELGSNLHLHSNPCGRGAHGTPLELARGGGHHRIAQMIEAAIKNNGQIDHMIEEAVSENKSTLATELANAAWDGDEGRVRALLDRGAPADTESYNGFSNGRHSALNGASRNGHVSIVSLLLEQPAQPDIESRCQGPWEVTPLQQAAFWGRADCAKILLENGASTTSKSGPGFQHQTAKQIAKQHKQNQWRELVALIDGHKGSGAKSAVRSTGGGKWVKYTNIDMCFQGDAEIIHDWKSHHTIESLKKIVEQKGYSAVCVGSFGHAALKNFDYQLTKDHCKPSQGYTNELYIYFPDGARAKPVKEVPPPAFTDVPAGFKFQSGHGEARGDQIGHITGGGAEGHCFGGDKMNWPLHWAAMIGDVNAINTLCAYGHDPNVKMTGWFDSEPLGWAASFGQNRAIEALVANGADPRRPANLAGNTPLADAQRENHQKTIKLIEEYLSGKRPIGERPSASSKQPVMGSTPVAMGMPVTKGGGSGSIPPLKEIVEKLRSELGLNEEMPMAQLVDWAVDELGAEVEKGAPLIKKAEAAWGALMGN